MMDYGLSDAEERAVFGYEGDDYEYDEGYDVDRQIDEMKEDGNWPFQQLRNVMVNLQLTSILMVVVVPVVVKHGVCIVKKTEQLKTKEVLNVTLLWWNMMHLLKNKSCEPEHRTQLLDVRTTALEGETWGVT